MIFFASVLELVKAFCETVHSAHGNAAIILYQLRIRRKKKEVDTDRVQARKRGYRSY